MCASHAADNDSLGPANPTPPHPAAARHNASPRDVVIVDAPALRASAGGGVGCADEQQLGDEDELMITGEVGMVSQLRRPLGGWRPLGVLQQGCAGSRRSSAARSLLRAGRRRPPAPPHAPQDARSSLPHTRDQCGMHAFSRAAGAGNASYCEQVCMRSLAHREATAAAWGDRLLGEEWAGRPQVHAHSHTHAPRPQRPPPMHQHDWHAGRCGLPHPPRPPTHAPQCFCYVCDTKAGACQFWGTGAARPLRMRKQHAPFLYDRMQMRAHG